MRVANNIMAALAHSDPWLLLTKNMSYVVDHLKLDGSLIGRLVDAGVLTVEECDELERDSTSRKNKLDRLLSGMLPKRHPSLFSVFCKVLKDVGQGFIVERIGGFTDNVRESKSRDPENEVKGHRVTAEPSMQDQAAAMGLPSWKLWDVSMPRGGWSYGRMAHIEGRVVVGGVDGYLHVLAEDNNRWDTFIRENGFVSNIVSHENVCLVVVKDNKKRQYEVEQFFLSEDIKWHPLTILPDEMQMLGFSVALHENLLYVVGGQTDSGDLVSTARVFDLESGHWLVLDDMPTKRSFSSSCIVNDTVYVGGGEIGQSQLSNVVEYYKPGSRGWRSIATTRNYYTTMTSVSNRLVATGGITTPTSSSPSNSVQLYDDRSAGWLPLPFMIKKRWGHGGFAASSGEIVMTGGDSANSIESLKID